MASEGAFHLCTVTYLTTLLFWLFAGATAIQLAAWWGLYIRLARHPAPGAAPFPSAPVSVIVCARNEALHLTAFLPAVLEQDFPEFEVIVVDDDSSDETAAVLQQFQQKYDRLRVIRLAPKTGPGKKQALEAGIAAARYERLVFTDADCRPASPLWLRHIAGGFGKAGVEIVLGYAPAYTRSGLLNRWIRFETLQTAMQYFSFALAGLPYMGVGRNLAWLKPVFGRVQGFSRHRRIPSGDDDLLVNAAARGDNTALRLHPEAIV